MTIKLKNLSHRLQLKMKKSSMQQHELKKYTEFTVCGKLDKMNKKTQKFANKPGNFENFS